MKTKYLIIGNSIAGVSCIEGIREVDRTGKITVVSRENVQNFSRPLTSYYLGGKISEKDMAFKESDFYTKNSVELLLGTEIKHIDLEKKRAIADTTEIYFEKLLIATGGKPFIPEIEGYSKDIEGICTFISLADAKALKDYIGEKQITEAVILGGGLIGLKCAEGLLGNNIRISIVEIADRLLSNTLDRQASEIIEEVLQQKGCIVYKKETVKKVCSKDKIIENVILASGTEIKTRLFVVAAGVRPEISLIKDTGIKVNRGIVVDQFMRTNIPDIYAAGDVAEGKDLLSDKNFLLAIWPAAAKQGKIAGINMAGGHAVYEGLFSMNSVEILEYPVISFGITNPEESDSFEILTRKEKNFYKKIVLQDNRIVGCIFAGKIERSGIYSGLIKSKIDVSGFKQYLLDDDFGLLMLPEQYRKHMVVGEGIEV